MKEDRGGSGFYEKSHQILSSPKKDTLNPFQRILREFLSYSLKADSLTAAFFKSLASLAKCRKGRSESEPYDLGW